MIIGTRYRLTAEINRQGKLADEIARAEAEISSQKRILSPSDDPSAAARISELGRAAANEATWANNLRSAAGLAENADVAISALADFLARAGELILGASAKPVADRKIISDELNAIAADIAALADTKDSRGRPLFRADHALKIPVSDTTTIVAVGTREEIFTRPRFGGPVDISTFISDAATAVMIPDDVNRAAAITDSIRIITQELKDHVASALGDQGVRASRIDGMSERLELSKMELAEQRSVLEAVDLTEAIPRLQSKQLALDAARAIFARLNQSTLFDLLR